MTAKFGHLLIIAIFIQAMPVIAREKCKDLLDKAAVNEPLARLINDPVFGPEFSFRDGTLSTQVGFPPPDYVGRDYSIRMVADPMQKIGTAADAVSRDKLLALARQNIESTLQAFDKMGMHINYDLQILVPLSPTAIQGSLPGSHVCFVNGLIRIPCLSGHHAPFLIASQSQSGKKPIFVIFGMDKSGVHDVADRFIVAHELAHITEKSSSYNDAIWLEARADLLSYLATGLTELTTPQLEWIQVYDSKGRESRYPGKVVRSISDPITAKVSSRMPKMEFYHGNSQIISSALYLVGRKFGPARIEDFINWMDKLESRNTNPERADILKKAVTESDIVKLSLQYSGTLVERWNEQNDLSPDEKQVVSKILKDKELNP